MIDRQTVEQVELVVVAARHALDEMSALTGDRELAYQVAPSTTFLAFAAASQLQQQNPRVQLDWINAGLDAVGKVIAQQGGVAEMRYGKGRRCADVTSEMATLSVALSRQDLQKTNLEIDRRGAREKLLYKLLLEFCAVSKLLSPGNAPEMMSLANNRVADVLSREGLLGANVIKMQ